MQDINLELGERDRKPNYWKNEVQIATAGMQALLLYWARVLWLCETWALYIPQLTSSQVDTYRDR